MRAFPKLTGSNPARRRNLALAVLAVALVAIFLAVALLNGKRDGPLPWVLGIVGTVAVYALVGALVWHGDARRFSRMQRGEGVLATWTVSATEWNRFLELNQRLDREGKGGANCLDLTAPPDKGVEVVVSDNAIYVGGEFHSIEKNATVVVNATYMEFRQVIANPNGSDYRHLFRFPIAAGAQPQAERVRRAYATAYRIAAADPRGKLYIALGFAVFVLIFVIWGVLEEVYFKR